MDCVCKHLFAGTDLAAKHHRKIAGGNDLDIFLGTSHLAVDRNNIVILVDGTHLTHELMRLFPAKTILCKGYFHAIAPRLIFTRFLTRKVNGADDTVTATNGDRKSSDGNAIFSDALYILFFLIDGPPCLHSTIKGAILRR